MLCRSRTKSHVLKPSDLVQTFPFCQTFSFLFIEFCEVFSFSKAKSLMDDSCKIKLRNNIDRIIDAISLGKDLFPPSNLRIPCSVCNRNCLSHQAYLFCTNCKKFCHRLCDGMTLAQYNQLILTEAESSSHWYCLYFVFQS